MRRYIYPLPYEGDPTQGWTTPSLPSPLDKCELVQPASGDMYPPAPADMVLVGVGCNELDAEEVEYDAGMFLDLGDLAALQASHDATRTRLIPLMDAAAAELVADGFTQVGVTDEF